MVSMMLRILELVALNGLAMAQNLSAATSSTSFSPTPVTTSVPSPTAPLASFIMGQGVYPPAQGEHVPASRYDSVLTSNQL